MAKHTLAAAYVDGYENTGHTAVHPCKVILTDAQILEYGRNYARNITHELPAIKARHRVPLGAAPFVDEFAEQFRIDISSQAREAIRRLHTHRDEGVELPNLDAPLRNGRTLYAHQKTGIEFLVASGWYCQPITINGEDERHIYPAGEMHWPVQCYCDERRERYADGWIVVHHSHDGREAVDWAKNILGQ